MCVDICVWRAGARSVRMWTNREKAGVCGCVCIERKRGGDEYVETNMGVDVRAYVHAFVYVYVRVCIHAYIHTYVHVYMRT